MTDRFYLQVRASTRSRALERAFSRVTGALIRFGLLDQVVVTIEPPKRGPCGCLREARPCDFCESAQRRERVSTGTLSSQAFRELVWAKMTGWAVMHGCLLTSDERETTFTHANGRHVVFSNGEFDALVDSFFALSDRSADAAAECLFHQLRSGVPA